MHPMELLDEVYLWNLTLVQLEILLVSVQDSCMVCAQCTIGLEIVVEVPDGTPR
jgi:hypothetical protein